MSDLHTLSHTKWMLFCEISRAVKLDPVSLLANKYRPLKHFLIIGDNARKWPWEDSHARGQKFESSSGHQYFRNLRATYYWVALLLCTYLAVKADHDSDTMNLFEFP